MEEQIGFASFPAEQFFVGYNRLEGKEFKALKQMDAKEAGKLIEVDD